MNSLILHVLLLFQTSIYGLHFTDSDGSDRNFGAFQNKKILIVNIATDSRYVNQLGSLEQLYQKYKDSLVIVAFPANDFNNEARTNTEIKTFLATRYPIHYLLATKISVSGDHRAPIFQWLSQASQNGVMDNPITSDFTKFLIDGQGNLMGVFSGSIDPIDESIQSALTQ